MGSLVARSREPRRLPVRPDCVQFPVSWVQCQRWKVVFKSCAGHGGIDEVRGPSVSIVSADTYIDLVHVDGFRFKDAGHACEKNSIDIVRDRVCDDWPVEVHGGRIGGDTPLS